MALRDLLVHADGGGHGVARVRLAAGLAARLGARLTVMHATEPSLAQRRSLREAELGLMPAAELMALRDAVETSGEADMQALREALDTMPPDPAAPVEWLNVPGPAFRQVARQARAADLTIIGHDLDEYEDVAEGFSFAEALLFSAGRPVLIVPASCAQDAVGQVVAVAWNGSRQAARAVADALPVIECARQVIVLTALPDRAASADPDGQEMILANLRRHNPAVTAAVVETAEIAAGDALQAEALRLGADLLVAGAYGHPRLWEKFLGGVTRELLARMRLPVLMAH